MSPSFAACLEGASTASAFQVGVLSSLAEAGLHPSACAGVSASAFSACALAHAPVADVERLWLSLPSVPLVQIRRLTRGQNPFCYRDLVASAMASLVSFTASRDAMMPYCVVATRVSLGGLKSEPFWNPTRADLPMILWASNYIPILSGAMPTFRFHGGHYVDGAAINPRPIDLLYDRVHGDIVLIVTNQRRHTRLRCGTRRVFTIAPSADLMVSPFSYEPRIIERAIATGRDTGRSVAGSLLRWLQIGAP